MNSEDIRFVSYFQIIVLTLSIFAFTYLVSESSKPLEPIEKKETWLSKFLKILSKENIPLVSATEQVGCCLETKVGQYCQEVLESQCESDFSIESCESRDECQLGCCYDEAETIFTKNAYNFRCAGLWDEEPSCNIPEAQEGCCHYGSTTAFVTQGRCKELTQTITKWDTGYEWDSHIPESICVMIPLLETKGACINGDSCIHTTYKECEEKYDGSFRENLLCTAPELNTGCKPTEFTVCSNNKVFFQDSCGNTANLYDASKLDDTNYWTYISPVYDSCNEQDSSCGNCDGLETICEASSATKASCVDIGCYFTHPITWETAEYQHGDEWCVYESQIGDGHDVPGSEHYIARCNYGEVEYSSLQSGRKKICTTLSASTSDGSYTFEKTMDQANGDLGCLYINKEYTDTYERIEACEEQPYCEVGMIWFTSEDESEDDVAEYITDLTEIKKRLAQNAELKEKKQTEEVTYCYSSYPSNTNAGCAMATMSFDVDLTFDWLRCDYEGENTCEEGDGEKVICKEGVCYDWAKVRRRPNLGYDKYLVQMGDVACKDGDCYAFNQEFLEVMNNYCTSLGDCGVSANVGGYIDGSRLSVTINEYNLTQSYLNILKALATPKAGQEIIYNATDLLNELEESDAEGLLGIDSDLASDQWADSVFGLGVGGTTITTLWGLMEIIGFSTSYSDVSTNFMIKIVAEKSLSILGQAIIGLAVTYASMFTSYWIGQKFQATPQVMNQALIHAGATTAVLSTLAIIGVNVGWISAGAVALWWLLPVALAAGVLIGTIYFWNHATRTVQTVTFSCEPWQPLTGADHCEECGSDGLPCSEYKCQSYGLGCEIAHTLEGDKCVASDDSREIPEVEELKVYDMNDYISENGIENFNPHGETLISLSTDGILEAYEFSEDEKLSVSGLTNPSPADYGFTVDDNVDAYDYLLIKLNTSTYSGCKLDVDESHVNYDDFDISMNMENLGSYTDKNHYYLLQYPDFTDGAGAEDGETETMPLFVRCRSKFGLESPRYLIKFSVNPGEDTRVPIITGRYPRSGSYASFDAEEKEVKILLSESANCSWSTEDKDYVNMEHRFECNSETCLTNFTLENEGVNTYYIRCKDANNNMNQEGIEYKINKLSDKITIDSINPTNNQKKLIGTPSIKINLSVQTSGGTNDHYCYYKYSIYPSNEFSKTGTKGLHEVYFSPFSEGTYTVNISCEDWNTKDVVETQTTFEIIQDSSAPKVLQNYFSDNTFYLVTDEFAECYYSTKDAFFNLEQNGTRMDGTAYEHRIVNSEYNTVYYIQCVDEFGNSNLMGKFRII